MENHYSHILNIANTQGLVRTSDFVLQGIPRVALTRMVRQGKLIRVGRGVYAIAERKVSDNSSFAEVSIRYPQAIICLLSALRFHNLTTQSPFDVWVAIPNKAHHPKITYPPLRILRFSDIALTHGVDEYQIEGVIVRITNIAKTVVDCFKFRNKIGLDVALEALQEAWSAKRITMDELWYYANLCRVAKVMRPYMESLQ